MTLKGKLKYCDKEINGYLRVNFLCVFLADANEFFQNCFVIILFIIKMENISQNYIPFACSLI